MKVVPGLAGIPGKVGPADIEGVAGVVDGNCVYDSRGEGICDIIALGGG